MIYRRSSVHLYPGLHGYDLFFNTKPRRHKGFPWKGKTTIALPIIGTGWVEWNGTRGYDAPIVSRRIYTRGEENKPAMRRIGNIVLTSKCSGRMSEPRFAGLVDEQDYLRTNEITGPDQNNGPFGTRLATYSKGGFRGVRNEACERLHTKPKNLPSSMWIADPATNRQFWCIYRWAG
jgi:hypothetical protein